MLENEGYDDTFGTRRPTPTWPPPCRRRGRSYRTTTASATSPTTTTSPSSPARPPTRRTRPTARSSPTSPRRPPWTPPARSPTRGASSPTRVTTVANQLTPAALTWKGYMEDMGNVPSRESAVCGHPAVGPVDRPSGGAGRRLRHPPRPLRLLPLDHRRHRPCDARVVPLGTTTGTLPARRPAGTTGLATDLKSVATTPEPQLHHPQPVQRRPRRPLRQPAGSPRPSPTSTPSCSRGCRSSPPRRPSRRTGCSR